MNIRKALKEIEKIESDLNETCEVPWKVWTCFFESKPNIGLAGDQISFGNSDFKSVEELREAVEWFVEQLDGKVKWRK